MAAALTILGGTGMKEPLEMIGLILLDLPIKCSAKDESRDMKTIRQRITYEGLSFLTITLPSFSDTFFQCIEKGKVTSFDFTGWKKKGCLPAFLQGFTSLVFDSHTGDLQYEPNIKSIQAIRQLCNLFKKIDIPCTSERANNALKKYIATDCDLGLNSFQGDRSTYNLFERVSKVVMTSIHGEVLECNQLIPHHGPGSTFERIQGNKKYIPKFFNWYDQLEENFDPSIFFNSEESYFLSNQSHKKTLPCSTVRVITVPKTQKGPRIIAMEPVAIQMAQQSIKDFLVEKIERGSLTAGHVNFTDQSINQRLALKSSKTRALATLDLSEASDRVSAKHIYDMLSVNPSLRSAIFCCRSHFAKVLGRKLCLNKFASMGSALCFPMESLYFFVLIVTSILEKKRLEPTYCNIYNVSRSVYVYGDDIIVPVNVADSVKTTLAKFGNVVSENKSFFNSHFRESCGVDAYDGVDITPTYLRHMIPQKRNEVSAILSLIATANQFFDKQYYNVFFFIQRKLTKLLGNLPEVGKDCAGLGWRYSALMVKERYNRQLQRKEVLTFVPYVIRKKDNLRSYNALAKCLLNLTMKKFDRNYSSQVLISSQIKYVNEKNLSNLSSVDKEHLATSPRRGALALKRRWVECR